MKGLSHFFVAPRIVFNNVETPVLVVKGLSHHVSTCCWNADPRGNTGPGYEGIVTPLSCLFISEIAAWKHRSWLRRDCHSWWLHISRTPQRVETPVLVTKGLSHESRYSSVSIWTSGNTGPGYEGIVTYERGIRDSSNSVETPVLVTKGLSHTVVSFSACTNIGWKHRSWLRRDCHICSGFSTRNISISGNTGPGYEGIVTLLYACFHTGQKKWKHRSWLRRDCHSVISNLS